MHGTAPEAIRLAVVGLGNCASSLLQGIALHRRGGAEPVGLAHPLIGGFGPGDIRLVAAWDIDRRKVGRDAAEAVFAAPNCTTVFCPDLPPSGVEVRMGRIADGVAPHMHDMPEARSFRPADRPDPEAAEVVRHLVETGTEVMINYLPVGSQRATEFYAACAIEARVAFVNAIPVFIASDPGWAARFRAAGVPVLGDDIKAQLGATILHRTLADLFARRGVRLDRTYQLNTGGNTDFLNMWARDRLASKKLSKTEAVQAVAGRRIADDDIHVGPSDYVAWQNDRKVAFIRLEGTLFGGVPMEVELRLSVEDSPNSAGVAIDLVRAARLARDRGLAGPVEAPSALFCKHPPRQAEDAAAAAAFAAFLGDRAVRGGGARARRRSEPRYAERLPGLSRG